MSNDIDTDIRDLTIEELRSKIRGQIEAEISSGRRPLQKREKHRAYYCLTEEKLGPDASNGKVSYRLLELLEEEHALTDAEEYEKREPWDHGGPLNKQELKVLAEALQEAADE